MNFITHYILNIQIKNFVCKSVILLLIFFSEEYRRLMFLIIIYNSSVSIIYSVRLYNIDK